MHNFYVHQYGRAPAVFLVLTSCPLRELNGTGLEAWCIPAESLRISSGVIPTEVSSALRHILVGRSSGFGFDLINCSVLEIVLSHVQTAFGVAGG